MDRDYEKAYKAVLKTATQWIKDGCSDKEKICLESVFPELRESEDERIRRGMIRFLNSEKAEGLFTYEARQSWIAYLEKQKEQKPIKWTDLTWKDIVELEGIINNVHYEFRNGIGQESFGNEVLEKFREYKGDEYLDEIEQKPAEWSEKHIADIFEKVGLAKIARE